jgi:hypothetical protein
MHDLIVHQLGARRVHWRYDDPSGVTDADSRVVHAAGRTIPVAAESRFRVRPRTTPKAA